MDAQAWALIGVVVGAVLGALAQIVADRLRERADKGKMLRALQQAAYTRLLSEGLNTLDIVTRFATAQMGSEAEEAGFLNLKEQARRLMAATSEISLIAPADTARAAHALADASLLIAEDGDANKTPNNNRRDTAARDFLSLARRDLGVSPSTNDAGESSPFGSRRGRNSRRR